MDVLVESDFVLDTRVGEIVATHPGAIPVFDRYGIDYCCGGKANFSQACERAGINPKTVWEEVVSQKSSGFSETLRVGDWDPGFLVDFIEQNHHRYIRKSTPEIRLLVEKTCRMHEAQHPELLQLRDTFGLLAEELEEHMKKEEKVLFPAIRELRGAAHSRLTETFLGGPISVMEEEHDEAGRLLHLIRELTDNYSPPPEACPTYRLTFSRLADFDKDLVRHIHLENNILFPRIR
jgi:regulator of cell morphogenesis and NO signaling